MENFPSSFSQVHTECQYLKPMGYPEVYLAGMSVAKIGNSSVTYKTALFPAKNTSSKVLTDLTNGHFATEVNTIPC